MKNEKSEVELLTDYFTEIYRSEERPSNTTRGLLEDFIRNQVSQSEDLDGNELVNALGESSMEYDWRAFEEEFQIFLEKRLDRYHDGSMKNPERFERGLEGITHYNLGYISVGTRPDPSRDIFMTSIIEYNNDEKDSERFAYAEYLDESEGLEAIRNMLENERREKVKDLINFGIKINQDRGLKAYRVIAEEDPVLAKQLLKEQYRPEIKGSMDAILMQNIENITDDFKDSFDF